MNRDRLFLGSCFSLISTSVCFAVIGAIMGPLKAQFALSNEEVGYIGGAAIWGFTISIFALGPLVDALGMKNLMRFAMLCHLAGSLIIIFTSAEAAFWMLFVGALILSLGNGTVEAVCNPLVATLYPEEKTRKLNQFHVWFPGGIVIGGVASYLLDQVGITDWRIKVALIIAPTVVYGLLFAGQAFPATERVQSGVSFSGMVRGALLRPLFLILLACMCITASLELGPNRWVPAVLEAGGIAGILVLAYINGLMAVLRFFAGPVIHRLSPTGILVGSAILAGVGLYWFSFAESTGAAFASATVFAIGICYFWPTMLGVVAERVPKSGALGLALMGGTGMLVVGVVTAPQMGRLADEYLHEQLDPGRTREVLSRVVAVYPAAAVAQPEAIRADVEEAVDAARAVVEAPGDLPEGQTADAMRMAISSNPGGEAADVVVGDVQGILNPADNYGGRMSFRYIAPWSIIIIIVFGVLYLRDRARGGYAVETIHEAERTGAE
jgi:fucose permease